MANRLKKKTPPAPNPAKLTADKVADVSMKEIVKDERTFKIAGTVSLLLSLFLFVAFTSYLFTWQEDQDKVHRLGVGIFSTDDIKVNNLLGVLGAYTAHFFIYKGFGIAAFLLCTFFFVLGVNMLFGRKIFSLRRNLKYVLAGLLVLSVCFAFLFRSSNFGWGGGFGQLLNAWLIKWIGNVGTGLLLLMAFFSYFVWRFNPTFSIPSFATAGGEKPEQPEEEGEADDEPFFSPNLDMYRDEPDGGRLFINKDVVKSNNRLKKEGKGVVVLAEQDDEGNSLNEFRLTEREEQFDEETSEEELPVQEIPPPYVQRAPKKLTEDDPLEVILPPEEPMLYTPKQVVSNMELEIKEFAEDEDVDDADDEVKTPAKTFKLDPYEPTLDLRDYLYPSLDLLEPHGSEKIVHDPAELESNKNQIIATLKNYDISIQRIAATVGPTVTLYEIVPAPGVRISRIKNLEDDIALSLAALGIRIIAPIPGKGTIGIEVPNVRKSVVSMKTLLASEKFQNNAFSLPIAIGKKIDNENFIVDLASMPHLLMAGATGQGKSVGLNAILVSLLYKKHPSQLKFVLVDPKKVELSIYRSIERHFLAKLPGEEDAIITDTKKVIHTLNALCIEMDNRYDLLKEAGVRNIREYNEKFIARKLNPEKGHQFLPFIVLVVDEFADLIMTAGKEVEMPIARLAQLARAVGIHLIIATQRPSVNIITGTIKANFPARIAFKVSSKIDSRTILDAGGAEQLIGKGDMLISYNGEITRLQCAFVDTPEVDKITDFIGDQRGYPDAFLLPEYIDEKELEGKDFDSSNRDPLFEDAARLVVTSQIGSTSLIQRRMKLGYNRAGRLMDQLEAAGIVGPNQGSKAREVQVKTEMDLQEILGAFD
ncbi:DNA translocase FtsK [Segetibacter sp. 3557_3]|uniref:DNA translocase FtsK n=1 Tax=Segetibacter sp. 3557_3 TaxID=2547429 RepID=UPI0010589694|nr:DNA translocase FtsK [Segetibacter sp. 3557_3]TDH25665.1 DNA translocase FtsK [Segetibacter sp. 3557_3]